MVDVSGVLNTAGSVIIIFGIVLSVMGLLVFGIWKYMQNRRYSAYDVVIYEKDGLGTVLETTDKAGVFVDRKTKNKLLFLKKNKNVSMNPDRIPFITRNGTRKVVYLMKYGLKNYVYLKPSLDKNLDFSVGEEDINWAINTYEKQKAGLMTDKLLQYMPFMVLAVVSVVILVMFVYFFKSFDSLKDLGVSMTEAANAIRDANSGTTVIT